MPRVKQVSSQIIFVDSQENSSSIDFVDTGVYVDVTERKLATSATITMKPSRSTSSLKTILPSNNGEKEASTWVCPNSLNSIVCANCDSCQDTCHSCQTSEYSCCQHCDGCNNNCYSCQQCVTTATCYSGCTSSCYNAVTSPTVCDCNGSCYTCQTCAGGIIHCGCYGCDGNCQGCQGSTCYQGSFSCDCHGCDGPMPT